MTSTSHCGTSGMISRIGLGISSATRFITAIVFPARNGGRPHAITYNTLPKLNKSERASSGCPWVCSGDM